MRVLILSQYFWPESFIINDLAVSLHQRGHDVTVLTGIPNYPKGRFYPGYGYWPKHESFHGVAIRRLPHLPRGSATAMGLAGNYLSFCLSASLFGPFVVGKRPDAMVVFQPSPATVGIPAVWLARWYRCPLIYWVQDLWPDSVESAGGIRSGWLLAAVDSMVRGIYRRCDRILVQSQGFARYITAQGVASEKIVLMPNWADAMYRPIALPADAPERQELPTGFCLVYAGNVGHAQGWQTWIEAAERTRHVAHLHWVVIGEGRQWAALRDAIMRRQLTRSVHLLGSRPWHAMPRYLAAADALLVTLRSSPALARTIPSKVQAYLACGRPIVAALEGDGAEVVLRAKAGYVVPPENPEALASAVLEMALLEPAQRDVMGKRARAYYLDHFEREKLLDRWERLLKELTVKAISERELKRCAA